MLVKKTVLGVYQENAYVIVDDATRDALIIDPGDEGESLVRYLESLKINLKAILLTHGHVDHVGAVDAVKDAFSVPVYISEIDMKFIEQRKMAFGKMKRADFFLKEGDEFIFAGKKVQIIETPGHSRGSLSYYVDGLLFSGDVLFQNSVGRTDLPGGNMEELLYSIKEKLMKLPGETRVFPGHGPETTLAMEKAFNGYLR
ncbi:MBL fold metallo-hydrolase [Proteiniclasticum ruminis]|jgi:glyoxylase-like metal-dependent hydrolase (beta-lactamase superfamily II)|uniref:Glyoxylase, beta-lactamase superfamily II n=1 Tax=Proteiniclasticum ruminis TaxID=398199 RepID=A0A1G8GC94_9CLOT|nr:MBL fold metallo-hydrolase [Proteiniclasticum ruminis]MBP9920665.1 MBL fold metallo-hydrolase [Proteiniclasticum sp.]SDH91950.1 Glyoxylase, beta-lactamase superfamily II [Proteiniclasticum ruminis]